LGLGRRLSHNFCDLHPAVRETGVATNWILVCGRQPGRSADSLAGGIDFVPGWGFTHRTSHSAVLRGVYDCLANCYYSGAGSRAFAKSVISIGICESPPCFRKPLSEPAEPAFINELVKLSGRESRRPRPAAQSAHARSRTPGACRKIIAHALDAGGDSISDSRLWLVMPEPQSLSGE
jgi:hypothetical protein